MAANSYKAYCSECGTIGLSEQRCCPDFRPVMVPEKVAEQARIGFMSRLDGPKTPSINVEGRDFYELCQAYRHSKEMMPYGMANTVQAFEALKEYVKTGKLPWPSYDEEELRLDATKSPQEKL